MADKSYLWMRLGIMLIASEEEIDKVSEGDEQTLIKLLKEKKFEVEGESYIPDEVEDVDFYLNPFTIE